MGDHFSELILHRFCYESVGIFWSDAHVDYVRFNGRGTRDDSLGCIPLCLPVLAQFTLGIQFRTLWRHLLLVRDGKGRGMRY